MVKLSNCCVVGTQETLLQVETKKHSVVQEKN